MTDVADKVGGLLGRVKREIDARGPLSAISAVPRTLSMAVRNKVLWSRIQNARSAEEAFTLIYRSNYWSSGESASGGGSTLAHTEVLRAELPSLFERFDVETVFDAPCGDFHWMRHVVERTGVDYVGGDIVEPLVAELNERYRAPNVRFVQLDLSRARFPVADLMICRDCLFHLSWEDTYFLLRNFCDSEIPLLLTTTHYGDVLPAESSDIKTGGFRKIDLFSSPYCFSPETLAEIEDWVDPNNRRKMCLWNQDQVRAVLGSLREALPPV